ncbi:LpqN/LpqT family lipoprotein [Mycobacterium sp. Y57]|uniref:LpqN/LpqT family lipoprotein n=1 Tax=Mycolicibacterium xanthum TaxID=2796469 RepID=UPI001C856CC8|nr:LpqN/LpqT family lipoprotein [Mycolicibacterium xanthum]MBX7434740.1 LpqN/LpqT family lipoprotein [Mycolicibacterium xanthum]
MAVAAVAALTAVAASGCATETPDYQSIWSTTSAASAEPTSTTDEAPLPLANYLEDAGVIGRPVAPDKLTDITVSIPTPPGWHPYQNTNLAPGTRMIAKGDTYPTAMLMVFELDGDFDVAEALSHAAVDAEMSQNFHKLNSSTDDFAGFPSSMIEGSYDLNGARMHTYNRVVIATGAPVRTEGGPPAAQQYLVQFTATGYADKAVEDADDIETIIDGFTVTVPNPADAPR